jgi:hypothetical protein
MAQLVVRNLDSKVVMALPQAWGQDWPLHGGRTPRNAIGPTRERTDRVNRSHASYSIRIVVRILMWPAVASVARIIG